MSLVVRNGATQKTFLKSRFVIFRCQNYVKKGYMEMTKEIYLQTLKKCPKSLHFPLLVLIFLVYLSKTFYSIFIKEPYSS